MAQMVLADRAKGLLNSTISDTATTFTLSVLNDANKFPSLDGSTGDYFYAYFSDAAGTVEKIKVTYRQNTTFGNGTYPCVRGIDTTARAWPGVGGGNDTVVAIRLGKREMNEHGHAASVITNTPAGGISATTVQAALNELDTEKSSTSHVHAASAITNTPAGNIAATTVQAALNELGTEKAPLASPALTGTPTAPTAAAGTNTTQLATTAFAQALYTSTPLSFRNKIINGNFDFWQRGTSLGAGTGYRYLADRWISVAAGSTIAQSQQAFALGQTSVPNEPTYFHRCVVASSAGAGNYARLGQAIESVRTFAGKSVVLTFYAKADASKNIAVEIEQGFGGGGGSLSVQAIAVTICALTTSWQKFYVSISVPSILGKTIGSAGNDSLNLNIWFDAGSSFNSRTNSLGQQSGTFDIAQVQLEEGTIATPFEVRPRQVELALCQRYFELGEYSLVWGAYAGGAYLRGLYPFKTTKRAIPSIVLNSSFTSNAAAASMSNTTVGSLSVQAASTAQSLAAESTGVWSADSEL